jgi:hypothetical protein
MPEADDATVVAPGPPRPDSTSVMPPVGAERDSEASDAPWSGRAEVRPPRPGDYTSTDDWTNEQPAEPRGKWWMPIVVGIVGLLLVALLGWGIWLILQAQNNGDETPPPAPTPTAPVTPTATQPTTQETTAAPTEPTTGEPSPIEVTIPALRGLPQSEAQRALSRRGLSARLRFVQSTEAAPGTVIDSDPAEGQKVPQDTVVTLVIASAPPTSATPSSSPTDQPGDD